MDLILACMAILLGAMCAYFLDEVFAFTPRVRTWLVRILE
jgi:hypothetical protein